MRELELRAWHNLRKRKEWLALEAEYGLQGFVRALEVTHGWDNGWHPHNHILLLFERMIERSYGVEARIAALWRDQVLRTMGEEYVPTLEHGAKLTGVTDGRYLCKLGLELENPAGTKRAENGNRTPWQIAADVVTIGETCDVDLWQAYVRGMKRAHQLEWTPGLKDKVEIKEKSDEEIVEEDDYGAEPIVIIPWSEWKGAMRPGRHGDWRLIRAAEKALPQGREAAAAAVREELEKILRGG
jgi:hypothetical protein